MSKCSVCGKEISVPNGNEELGIEFHWTEQNARPPVGIGPTPQENIEYLQRQLGSYKMNRTYNVCIECWMRSLGIKPDAN